MPAVRLLRAFDAVDRRLLGTLTRHQRPRLESALTRLSRSAVEVALDGEVRGHLPGTFDVVPDGLRVVTPASISGSG